MDSQPPTATPPAAAAGMLTADEVRAQYPTVEARFRAGVGALFTLWSALDLMRENMTGGVDTEDKILDLHDGVLEQFELSGPGPFKARVTQQELEDMLLDFTERELHTDLQDGSVEQVADYTFRLWRDMVLRDDLSVLQKILLGASRRRKAKPLSFKAVEPPPREPASQEEEEEEEEEESEHDGDQGEDDAAKQGSDGAEGGDDHGWTVVGAKSGKKGGKK